MHKLAGDNYLADPMKEAKDADHQTLQIEFGDATALHGMGLSDSTKGQTKSTIDDLKKSIALDLNNSEYHVTLGIAHSTNNNLNVAKLSFQEAVRLKPSNLSARYNFALYLFKSRRIKKCGGGVPSNLEKTCWK